jgi:glycosyltransferase involved in cell wall biosynthesis
LCRKADAITATSNAMVESSEVLGEYKDKITVIPLSIAPEKYTNTFGAFEARFDTGSDSLSRQQKQAADPFRPLSIFPPYQNDSSSRQSQPSPDSLSKQNDLAPQQSQPLPAALPDHYILYVGRLSYYKGLTVLLDAYQSGNIDCPLVIAGEGELAGNIDQTIRDGKSSIVFINRYLSEEEKHYLLANCLFFVLPSVYPSEAFGIIQLEAMIYGKPVINTSLPTGVPWVSLHEKTGLTVPPFDSNGLADAMKRLCNDKQLCIRLGAEAKLRVHTLFNEETTKEKLTSLYRKVVL